MAGYSDFLRKRQTQAQSFLSSGSVNYNPLPVAGSNTTGCQDSTGCASGWACIGGICVKEDPDSSAGGSGNLSGCGSGGADGALPGLCGASTDSYLTLDESLAKVDAEARKNLKVGDVLVLQGINGGSVGDGQVGLSLNGKCLKTGCSGTSTSLGTNDACCGKSRCCRLGSVVQCFCGECPPPPQSCSQFCTSFQASNGYSAGGCTNENTCDECSFCTDLGNFAGTTCIPKGGSGPCWCGTGIGRNCTSCEECGSDGTCEFVRENCYPTPIPPVPGPDDGGSGSDGGDPCAGSCSTITVCGSDPDPICPPKNSCSQTGTITVGTETCKLFEQCDKSSVPESCGFCDCSCDGSCPNCQVCNPSTGKCEPDPSCPNGECPEDYTRCGDRETCCEPGKRCQEYGISSLFDGSQTAEYPTNGPAVLRYDLYTSTCDGIQGGPGQYCRSKATIMNYSGGNGELIITQNNSGPCCSNAPASNDFTTVLTDYQRIGYTCVNDGDNGGVPDGFYYYVAGWYDTIRYSWGDQQIPGCVRCIQSFTNATRALVVSFSGQQGAPGDLGTAVQWTQGSPIVNTGQCPGRDCGQAQYCSDQYTMLSPKRSDGSSAGASRLSPGSVATSGGPGGNFRNSTLPYGYLQVVGVGATPAEANANAFSQEPSPIVLPSDPPPEGCP